MTQPPNVSTTAGSGAAAVVTMPGPAGLTPEEREYYTVRWRALLLELRFIAGRMGWEDRLHTPQN